LAGHGRVGGNDGSHRATPLGGREIVVTIEIVAAQGDEEVAAVQRPAIGRHAGEAPVVALQAARGRPGSRLKVHHVAH